MKTKPVASFFNSFCAALCAIVVALSALSVSAVPPTAVIQPTTITVAEGATATFTTVASGTLPLTYQWKKDGVDIPGATSSSYTTPALSTTDNGAAYSVVVSNVEGVASANAAVTVTADTAAPTLVSAVTRGNPNGVTVTFSEPVSQATAANAANYSINNGATVTSATLGADLRTVTLATSFLSGSTIYTVTVKDIKDRSSAGNSLSPNPTIASISQAQGFILRKFFQFNFNADALSSWTNNARFPNDPTSVNFEPNFEYPVNGGNEGGAQYANQFTGFIHPPVTGDYTFYVSGDDQILLYLSTDESPANKRLIAREPVWNNARQWLVTTRRNAASPENKSAPIRLDAGKKYFVEALQGEGGGGDSIGVTWQLPGQTVAPANGSPPISGAFLSSPTPSGPVGIARHPSVQSVVESGSATFTVEASGTPPYTYQWRSNGVAIAGATGSSFTIPSATLAQSGANYSVEVKNFFSSAVSGNAILTVTPDTTAPVFLSAIGGPSLTEVTLNFSEAVSPGGQVSVVLNGAAERPTPVTTTATGAGTVTLNGSQLSFNISYSGLSGTATAAHFHAPGNSTVAAGVVINLAPFNGGAFGTSGSLIGTVTLTPEQLGWLVGGLMYVNVHTAANPGGEIRGQVPSPALNDVFISGLTLNGARLSSDGKSITVTTSLQDTATLYPVIVNGIKDVSAAANPVAANTTIPFTSFAQSTGYLLREVYTGITGTAVTDLTGNAKFPNSPDLVQLIPSFEARTGGAETENYGQRVSGFIIPPETGNYVFFISADDNAALYLSTDDTPANKKLIARETVWSNSRQWLTSGGSSSLPSKRSDQFGTASEWPGGGTNIVLTAGKRYYVEALQKEGGGGDNLGVTWKLPSQTAVPADGSATIAGTFLATAATPVGASITITKHPEAVTIVESSGVIGSATFTVEATGRVGSTTNVPVAIQWARNGENIPGATGTSYTTPSLTAANNGDLYVALVSIPGRQLFSRGAELTVRGDITGPTLVSAKTFNRPDKVAVVFSESVNATATNAANYKINNSVTVASVTRTGANSVELTTSPILSGNLTPYVLTVSGVQDIAVVGNTIVANSAINISTSDPAFPSDFGVATAGFQDDFNGTTLNSNWKARGPSSNIWTIANGMLSVANGAGDPNHLLYEVAGYDAANQEVLARIRIKEFGNTDASRGGIGVGVATNNSQGINLHFRNNTQDGVVGKQFKLLDDARAWGPAGYKVEWATNTWYWLRLKQTPNTNTGQIDIFGKAWLGDGTQPEPVDYQLLWDRYPTATTRTGYAGVTGGSIYAGTPATSASFDVDYILIKAAGLSSVTPGGSGVAIRKALFVTGATPSASDLVISNRLATALGYVVSHVTAPNAVTANAQGKDIIIVSSTVTSGDMLANSVHKFRDVAVPIINWEASNYDDLGMTGTAATEFGTVAAQTSVNIVRTSHPLAAGLSAGTNILFTAAQDIAAGNALTNAVVIARSNDGTRAVIFAYEAGDLLFGGIRAAERRIALPLSDAAGTVPTPAAVALFDAAVAWANPLVPQPVIVSDPANATALENTTASFSVEANGNRPFTYQWSKNKVIIAGATNRLVTVPITFADNGAAFTVQVSNGAGSITSGAGALTVTPETTTPTVVSAVNNGNPTSVTVVFSEPVSATSAVSLANYSINNGIAITGAALGANSSTVVLTTTPLRDGTSYSLFVSDVTDRAAKGNAITPNPTRIPINTLQGQLLVEIFTGITGTAVNDLLNAAKFRNNTPDSRSYINTFNLPQSAPNIDNFGARVSGYFTPQSNGVYRFFIRSDDASQLFMNTNNANSSDPGGKVFIARNDTANANYGAATTGISPNISMVAAQRYYVEALMKEGGGGDYVQVAVREAAVTGNPPNTESIGTQFLTAPTGPVLITRQPASQSVLELQQAATFTVAAQGAAPVTYQWRANGVAITGATAPSFTVASFTLAQSGTAYSVEVKNAFSSVVSSNAILTVTADVASPALVSTVGSQSLQEVTLNFSEPIVVLGQVNVTLSGAAERPTPVVTSATGSGTVTLGFNNQLSFNITYAGLSGTATAAHFHAPGDANVAAGVVINLAPFNGGAFGASGSLVGTVTLTSEQLNWLQTGAMYVNIHTTANPGGEIRGQVPAMVTGGFSIAGLTVIGARRGADAKSVLLTTTLQEAGLAYTVAVSGVRDASLAGNLLAPATGTFTSFTGNTGYLLREVYSNIGGTAVTDLTSNAKFPYSPDISNLIPSFEAPTNFAENYGQRVSGFIIPPETGNYVFFLATDDLGELYLSTDELTINKKLIARETAWSNARQWVTSGGSSSLPFKRSDQFTGTQWPGGTNITLTAGKRYYVEALMKEGGGGDVLGVAWKLPSQASAPADGAAPIAGTFLASAANPVGTSVTITRHPDTITVPENTTTTFTVAAVATVGSSTNSPIAIQWAKNGELIAGATATTYTTPSLSLTNTGDLYVALISVPGKQLFTRGAVLTVTPDKTPPTLVSANTLQRPANVTVVFSEPIANRTATNTANYKISNGFNVTGAAQTSPTTVELTVASPPPPTPVPVVPTTNVLVSIASKDQLWSYENTGQNLGTAWKDRAFNDSAWPKGPALLAFESSATVEPTGTVLKRTNSAGVFNVTDYFRTHFTFTGNPTQAKLFLRHIIDDGAVIYLNGTELHRFGIAPGASFTNGTFFSGHEQAYTGPIEIPTTALVVGDNVIAAEVHQSDATSSDVVFGLELVAITGAAPPPPSTSLVSITNTNQLWRYDNTGSTNLGTAWKEKAYNDAAWPQGAALFAFETGATAEAIRTQLKRTNNASTTPNIVTDYFRTHFNFTGDPTKVQLKLRHVVDDGVAVYLNGTEIHRFFLPTNTPLTSATVAVPSDHENRYEGPFDIPSTALVVGDNVIAAEVHQNAASSSDMVFGLELTAVDLSSSGGTGGTGGAGGTGGTGGSGGTAPPVSTAPLVYEGFDYPVGQLIGQGAGTGWSGPWGVVLGASPATGSLVQAGSMSYTDSKGNTLLTTGGKGFVTGLPGTAQPAREIPGMRGVDGTTTWLSYIAVRQGPSTNVTANPFPRGCSIAFFSNAVETIAVGNNSGAPTNAWKLYINANDSLSQFTSKPYNEQSFVLMRIDHKAGNDDAYLFLNPSLDSEPSIASAAARSLGVMNFSFNRVRPFAGAQDDANRRPYAELQFDELRIGESFASVAPFTAGALAEFNFDEGGGSKIASVDGKLTGNFIGTPTFSTDTPSGQKGDFSLQFAAGQRVEVPDPNKVLALETNSPSYTVQAWVKFATPAARGVFFYNNGPGGAVSASVFTNRTVHTTTLGIVDRTSSAVIPNDGGWHHIAIIQDSILKEFRFYVDGMLGDRITNYTQGVIFTRTNRFFSIGSEFNNGAAGLQYVGSLDRLKYSKGVVAQNALDFRPLGVASPFSIGLNFGANEVGGSLTNTAALAGVAAAAQANWNNLSGQNGTNVTLVGNAAGTAVPVPTLVRWTSNGTWASGSRGEPNGTNFAVGTPNHILMEGYLDTGNATTTSVTITNVASQLTSGGYNLYVYTLGGVAGRGGSYRVLNAATGAVLQDNVRVQSPANPTSFAQVPVPPIGTNHVAGTYFVVSGLTAPAITIEATTVTAPFGGTPRAPINAVQLVAIPQIGPPPAVVPPLPGGLILAVSGIQDLSSQANTIAANSQIAINAGFSAGADTLETTENTPVSVPTAKLLANDTLPGAQPTVSSVSAASIQGGTVRLAGGTVTYTPKAGFRGSDSFTYTANGGGGAFAFGTVNVTVISGNAPAQNQIAIIKSDLGPVIAQFLGIPGRTYKVQASTDLTVWTDIGTVVASSTGIITFVDNDGGKFAQRFYRTVAP